LDSVSRGSGCQAPIEVVGEVLADVTVTTRRRNAAGGELDQTDREVVELATRIAQAIETTAGRAPWSERMSLAPGFAQAAAATKRAQPSPSPSSAAAMGPNPAFGLVFLTLAVSGMLVRRRRRARR